MSHTAAQARRAGRNQPPADQPTADQPTADQPTPDGQAPAELTEEQKTAEAALKAKAEADAIEAVQGFTATEQGEFRTMTTPVRNRRPVQLAMDKVAAQAYEDWTNAGRPTTWQRMPVVTYFLEPEAVKDYRTLIRKAVQMVTVSPYEKDGKTITPSGARVRFGNEFVLTETMARKIGKPDNAGKTVLAWAAIDKRNVKNGEDASE